MLSGPWPGPLPTHGRSPRFQPNPIGPPQRPINPRPINRGSVIQAQAVEPTQLTIPRQMTPPGIQSQDYLRNQPTLRFSGNGMVRQDVQPRPPVEPNAPGATYPSGPLPEPLAIQPVPLQPQLPQMSNPHLSGPPMQMVRS